MLVDADLEALTRLWHEGWHESHAPFVPKILSSRRTPSSFRDRLEKYGDALRVAGPIGAPVGMCTIREDELEQLFVAPAARGTGIATVLLLDGESRLAKSGVKRAHLSCVIGNERAARFYSAQSWEYCGVISAKARTGAGFVTLEVKRFEKDVTLA